MPPDYLLQFIAHTAIDYHEAEQEARKTKTCSQLASVESLKGASVKKTKPHSYRPKSARKRK